jgi:hypothetical protein
MEKRMIELPELRLDHLARLCDTVGIFQHAAFTVPKFSEGYCTDDNARALLLALKLQFVGRDSPKISSLASTFMSFIAAAFDSGPGRFRNFLEFDRTWRKEPGSEECHAHAIWALGYCINHSDREGLRLLAAELFERALPALRDFISPRAWATSLLGIEEYLSRLGGDRLAGQIRDDLVGKLLRIYESCSAEGWRWYEDRLAYANARIPHALIACGRSCSGSRALEVGLESLAWLTKAQTSNLGNFSPVGTNGFHVRGGERARFDQQPIEAQATISACASAYDLTEDPRWIQQAKTAFDWFMGRNDIGLVLYDSETGGCHDGLHIDRVNQNEGCESTLAFLLSLVEMQALQNASADT